MRAHFIRGQEPKDAMDTGQPDIRFAAFMIEKENELKEKNSGPIWDWWESYSGDFWEDIGINTYNKILINDFETWIEAYKRDPKRSLIQKEVIQKLLTIDEMPDDIDKWLWPGPNKRKNN